MLPSPKQAKGIHGIPSPSLLYTLVTDLIMSCWSVNGFSNKSEKMEEMSCETLVAEFANIKAHARSSQDQITKTCNTNTLEPTWAITFLEIFVSLCTQDSGIHWTRYRSAMPPGSRDKVTHILSSANTSDRIYIATKVLCQPYVNQMWQKSSMTYLLWYCQIFG